MEIGYLNYFYNVTVEYRIGLSRHRVCIPILSRTKNGATQQAILYVNEKYKCDSISDVDTIQMLNAL